MLSDTWLHVTWRCFKRNSLPHFPQSMKNWCLVENRHFCRGAEIFAVVHCVCFVNNGYLCSFLSPNYKYRWQTTVSTGIQKVGKSVQFIPTTKIAFLYHWKIRQVSPSRRLSNNIITIFHGLYSYFTGNESQKSSRLVEKRSRHQFSMVYSLIKHRKSKWSKLCSQTILAAARVSCPLEFLTFLTSFLYFFWENRT